MRHQNLKWRYSGQPANLLHAAHANRLMRTNPDSPEPDENFIGAREAAKWLAIPLRSFRLYVQQGLLPSYKLGRHRLFRRDELLAAVCGTRTVSRSEILR